MTSAQAEAPGGEMNPPAATPGDLATGGEPGAPGMEPSDACGMNPAGAGAMQNERGGPGLAGPKGDRPGLTAEGEGDLETGGRPAPMPKAVLAPKVKSGSMKPSRRQSRQECETRAAASLQSAKSLSQHKPSARSINKTEVSVSIGHRTSRGAL